MKRNYLCCLVLVSCYFVIEKSQTEAMLNKPFKVTLDNRDKFLAKPINKNLDKVVNPRKYRRNPHFSKSRTLNNIRNHSLPNSPLVNDITDLSSGPLDSNKPINKDNLKQSGNNSTVIDLSGYESDYEGSSSNNGGAGSLYTSFRSIFRSFTSSDKDNSKSERNLDPSYKPVTKASLEAKINSKGGLESVIVHSPTTEPSSSDSSGSGIYTSFRNIFKSFTSSDKDDSKSDDKPNKTPIYTIYNPMNKDLFKSPINQNASLEKVDAKKEIKPVKPIAGPDFALEYVKGAPIYIPKEKEDGSK